jgi:glyoxylase-like metal-dependent hydrolase (beta-lactamase superfamily II)
MKLYLTLLAMVSLGACRADNPAPANGQADADTNVATPGATLSLARLDCGNADFKDMNGFFSDRAGVYPPGPGKATDSCYLIRHGDQVMIWDTGFPATARETPVEQNGMTARLERTLAEQLQQGGITPEDVDILGISHLHGDHIGQAAQFTNARLVIGKQDFAMLKGRPEDSFQGWRGAGAKLTLADRDVDIFGDGSVVALRLPGHTPDHLALRVNLKSGPVLLSGDLYHSTIAREKRSMPGFNTSREQTLASMDKFEKLVKDSGAKVVIQHEPGDIGKLPAFPQEAR